MKQTRIDLREELPWRIRLVSYGLEYVRTDEGEANRERILDDLGRLVLEMRHIIEGESKEGNTLMTYEGPCPLCGTAN